MSNVFTDISVGTAQRGFEIVSFAFLPGDLRIGARTGYREVSVRCLSRMSQPDADALDRVEVRATAVASTPPDRC
jgi:hypothetical protein